jgi:hypothetical protein
VGPWNSQILGALGGIEGPLNGFAGAGCMHGRISSVGTHALTQGVGAIGTACGGYAIGGTQLFAYNIATLWRTSQNVLTILDGNIFDDLFAAYDATVFRDRVLGWLAEDLTPSASTAATRASFGALDAGSAANVLVNPEPSTLILVGAGLLTAAGVARRSVRTA